MQEKTETSTPKKKGYIKRMFFVLIFLLITLIFLYINIKGEYLQRQELGEQYLNTYTLELKHNLYAFASVFLISYFIIYISTAFIKKGLKKFFIDDKKEMPKLPNKSISLISAVIISLILSPELAEKFMLAINPSYFGINDPIFNMDIGYYIFQKPFIETVLFYLTYMLIGITIYIGVYYIFVFNKYFDGIDIEILKKNTFLKQLITNVIILGVLISVITFIKTNDILYSSFMTSDIETGLTMIGANYIDVVIRLWGYRILSVIIIGSLCFALYYIVKKDKKKAIISILLVPAFLIALLIISMIYNIVFVRSNELDKEKNYIKYNIESTRNAYNIAIEEKQLEYSGTITLDEVNGNQGTLKNVPIIDNDVTLTTLKEYQSNVGVYSFKNTQLVKYNNSLQYLTPREILTNGTISNTTKTYEYTHGYSAIITSAVETDEYGSIKYIQSDFNSSNKDLIKINQPRIYYGLETEEKVIVNSNGREEFDYPITTTSNTTNVYDGSGGLELNTWDRIVLGISTRNLSLVFGINMNDSSKVLTNRQIINRAKKALPQIMYDENPYLVINKEGRLVWVIDGYTTTNQYPYSTRTYIENSGERKEINYIRNSVKVLVDAYDGKMNFYITDRDDPIIMAYNKLYPELFAKTEENIPEDIIEHITYPKFLYNIQAKLLTAYHDVQPDVLYRNDDVWEIASDYQSISTNGKTLQLEPNYTITSEGKLGVVLPYSVYNKKNINSYLVGTNDSLGNNKLIIYKFNSNSNVLGPTQLQAQIEEDDTIASELKSISVTGTKLLKNTLIIPVANTILYVEPIYQVRLNEVQIPILKKVIVASGNKLAIGNNFKDALANLLSQYAVNINVENTDDVEGLITQIIKANNNLNQSSTNLDWELMGKDIKRLQELISTLEGLKKQEEAEKENTTGNNLSNSVINNVNSNIIE